MFAPHFSPVATSAAWKYSKTRWAMGENEKKQTKQAPSPQDMNMKMEDSLTWIKSQKIKINLEHKFLKTTAQLNLSCRTK